MNQHLIAIDLDGTTLNNQSQLSPDTIMTLRQLAANGHIISIVTVDVPTEFQVNFMTKLG
ncbi:hypothetical protein FD16_GL001801 [Paucilactobacillus suebicus DSM 5007 = KCTC 3549]|uniref:HAD superfamily hydrolase n=1 Tax=Paucilactobacillus suebicus DSM 5007 = KCTC 3549 TaxID=1423807 RepID=A0A0R1W1R2_9LACO|nr:hypothetical protein FD16_GL001801 [Paucilactobacillus suebicus DSM 5007 = KCTC 3549]